MNATPTTGNKPVQPVPVQPVPVRPLPVVEPTPTVPLADARPQRANPAVAVATAPASAPSR
jgi:hypothetical protein